VVFNTCMTGYQEVLTDPSYTGQLVCMTYPLQGNYGVNSTDRESPTPKVAGFIVREAARRPSSWRSEDSLDGYLKASGIVAIADVYDALQSARPYKPSLSRDQSLAILAEGVGNHFDPAVFAAFAASLEAIRDIDRRFSDQQSSESTEEVEDEEHSLC
jgi:hypothetical protein